MTARITVEFAVPVGYIEGDHARLFGNSGAGAVDFNTPLDQSIYELFPKGSGLFGFGHAPFGYFRFGHGHSMRTAGFGHLPFGHFPFGHGTAVIRAKVKVTECGAYKFAFGCCDKAGNLHVGTPDEVTAHVHIAPEPPTRLKKYSYDKATDILILEVA